MQVLVNGEPREVSEAIDLAALVEAMALGEARIAVEVNEAIVPRSEHASTPLNPGDRVEVVQAIGGG